MTFPRAGEPSPEFKTGGSPRSSALAGLAWFLVANVLVFRFFRPISPVAQVLSFRGWIDWLLIAVCLLTAGFRLSTAQIAPLFALAVVVAANLSEFGLNTVALTSVLTIVLAMSVPLFFGLFVPESDSGLRHFATRLRQVMNAYFFLNSAAIYLQISGALPIPSAFVARNPNLFDHFDGLIRVNVLAPSTSCGLQR